MKGAHLYLDRREIELVSIQVRVLESRKALDKNADRQL